LADGNLPKQLATIEFSPTPSDELAALDNASPSPSPSPAATLAPIVQISPSPYVGVFIGETAEGGAIPTLPPLAQASPGALILGNPGACNVAVGESFQAAYQSNPALQGLGCPLEAAFGVTFITQRFERGRMFWRDTREIIITSDSGDFWRLADTWAEGQAIDDPSLSPPEGLAQPIRGFGLAWRSDPRFQEGLGWAQGPEFPISGQWQNFQGGVLFIGENNQLYALPGGTSGQLIR
jgi:hypothetical protein